MRVAETIDIVRRPEEVWAFVADHANDRLWCSKVKAVEPVRPHRWRAEHKPVPLRPAVSLMVQQLELDPPRRLKLREEDSTAVIDVEYELERTEFGTRFTQVSDIEWKTLPRVLHRPFARGVQLDLRRQLERLKRVLEEQAPA